MLNDFFDKFKNKELDIKPQMQVGTFKSNFEATFGIPVRVYNGARFADDSSTLASIRQGEVKGHSFTKVKMNMKVKEAELLILKELGIKVQICNKKGELANDDLTLGQVSRA